MGGDALAQALALQQAPLLRFSLRNRPLAAGMPVLLQLAAASQPLLADTARRLELDEAELLEVVRAYLQQVLFEGEPDAYRVLAATPATPLADIREQHRWLQRWLHPDRRGQEWEALFATRVNWAWSQLRTAEARTRYDAQLRQQRETGAQPLPSTPEGGAWMAVPVEPRAPRHHPFRVAALSLMALLCVGLLYLAISREDAARRALSAVAPPDMGVTVVPVDVPGDAVEPWLAPGAPVPSPIPVPVVPHVSEPAVASAAPSSAPLPLATRPAGKARTALESPTDAIARTETSRQPDSAMPVARSPATAVPVVPSMPAPVAGAGAASGMDGERPGPAVVTQAGSDSGAIPVQAARAGASAPAPARQQAIAAVTVDATPAALPALRRMPQSTLPNQAVVEPALAELAVIAPLALPSSPPVHEAGQRKGIAADTSDNAVSRMEAARTRVDELAAYFRAPGDEQPNWPDAGAAHGAQASRASLRERNGMALVPSFELDSPYWKMTDTQVEIQVAYRAGSSRDLAERGLLRAAMVWSDQAWQFTRIELEPFR